MAGFLPDGDWPHATHKRRSSLSTTDLRKAQCDFLA